MDDIPSQDLQIGGEYMIVFPAGNAYTIFDGNGASHSNASFRVNFDLIIYCGRSDVDVIGGNLFKYYLTSGYGGRESTRFEWYGERDLEFENQFPYFPYAPSEKNTMISLINMNRRICELEKLIREIGGKLDRLMHPSS